MTNTEIELAEVLDFEFELPCDTERDEWGCGGDNAAVWKVIYSGECCGNYAGDIRFFCNPCLKIRSKVCHCPACGFSFNPGIDAYKSITRIKE